MKNQVFIGTSGWSYSHWKENFYPKEVKNPQWLAYYSNAFKTVEVNTTFYHTPRLTTVENWFKQVPDDFIFSIKINRYITHRKRLKECQEPLKVFYGSLKKLKSKVGPILIQLPPSFQFNKERLLEFLDALDEKYIYTMEFRHPSWFQDEVYDILREKNVALCITDLGGSLSPEVVTASFVYIRLHGPEKAYQGTYGLPKLKAWKKKIKHWLDKASVYCYFDNDEKGYAIQDAKTLQELWTKDY